MRRFLLWSLRKFLKALSFLIAIMPVRVRFLFGDFMGLLWFDVFRIRRKVTLSNLKLAFPEWTQAQRKKVARRSCCNMGRNLFDYPLLPFLQKMNGAALFRLEGEEHLKKALSQGKGVCLLTLHLGNGDMATAGLALHGYPIHLISKEFKIQWINDLWFGVRRKLGTQFIAPRNSSYQILKALKANGIVAFVMDQFMGPPIGVRTTFFGHPTGTALGLAIMAERSKAPVVPVYNVREADGRFTIRFEPEIPFVTGIENRDESLARMTQIYNDKLEEFVRLYPEQWMWVHRRWKEFRE